MNQKAYVYVIGVSNTDICKIGVSRDPKKRLASLRSNSYPPPVLHFVTRQHTEMDAYRIEKEYHTKLKRKKLHGEWFSISPMKAEEIVLEAQKTVFVKNRESEARYAETKAKFGYPLGVFT